MKRFTFVFHLTKDDSEDVIKLRVGAEGESIHEAYKQAKRAISPEYKCELFQVGPWVDD